MTAQLITHPFRLQLDGSVATAPPGSDELVETQIAALVGTQIGERPMAWTFGIPDAAFGALSAEDIRAGLALHGPDGISINGVTSRVVDEVETVAVVSWDRR